MPPPAYPASRQRSPLKASIQATSDVTVQRESASAQIPRREKKHALEVVVGLMHEKLLRAVIHTDPFVPR